jgi:hypothetical protein
LAIPCRVQTCQRQSMDQMVRALPQQPRDQRWSERAHSLRHNFKDALRAGGVQEDLSDALTGHSVATVGRSYGARARHGSQRHKVIVARFGMPRLVEAIEKVDYPSIDLEAVSCVPAGGGARRLKTQRRLEVGPPVLKNSTDETPSPEDIANALKQFPRYEID